MQERQTIVVAVDLTSHADQVVERAFALARSLGAELLVVHAVHELKSLFGIYLTDKPVDALQQEIVDEAHDKLVRLTQRHLAGYDVPYRTELLRGTPWKEIVSAAAANDALMVVVGVHIADKPEHKVLGSTADRILRAAPCPVLVVPARRAIDKAH